MVYRLRLLLVGLAIFLPCTSAKPDKLPPKREGESVTVVAKPKFYVIGSFGKDDEMLLFKKPARERMVEVDGFIFEVIRPAEYAGRIIGMHHDGLLASGDPYKLFVIGRRYEFKFPKDKIGQLDFGACSVGWPRKALPK